MTRMLECCLSGAILERKRDYPSWLLNATCLAACGPLRGYRTWIARRPSFGYQTGLSLFVEFKYLLEFC